MENNIGRFEVRDNGQIMTLVKVLGKWNDLVIQEFDLSKGNGTVTESDIYALADSLNMTVEELS